MKIKSQNRQKNINFFESDKINSYYYYYFFKFFIGTYEFNGNTNVCIPDARECFIGIPDYIKETHSGRKIMFFFFFFQICRGR